MGSREEYRGYRKPGTRLGGKALTINIVLTPKDSEALVPSFGEPLDTWSLLDI